jgi:hypothetical protein
LREAKPDLVGITVYDSIPQDLDENGPLCELRWSQREIENYLCYPETLLAYADQLEGTPGPLFESPLRDRQRDVMQKSIEEVAVALRVLGRPDPFGPDIKASDDFLGPVFQSYFEKLGLRNMMQKTDYHGLARLVPKDRIDPEIGAELDRIVAVSGRANPLK